MPKSRKPVTLLSCALLCGVCLVQSPLRGQDHWISLTNSHFEMYTTRTSPSASQDLQTLEGIRSLFAGTKPFGPLKDGNPVKVIAFQSKAEYAPYALRSVGLAYYTRSQRTDYIVLGDTASGNRVLATHEFTHFAVANAGLKLPIWLNEGLAELYSTQDSSGSQVTIGIPPARHLETVRRQRLIPWPVLFAVDLNSPQYNESDKVSLFYAQSWAMTHMLALNPEYAGRFHQFLLAVSDGQSSGDALQSVYHKSISQIDADLSSYIQQRSLPKKVLDVAPAAAAIVPAISQPPDFDVAFALADVLSSRPTTLAEGESKFASLAERYPQRPEPEEALGILAFQQNHKAEAQRHLAAAVQRHTKDPEMLYQFASLQQDAGMPVVKVAELYQKVLDVQPGFDKAQIALALIDFESADFESTIARLATVKEIDPGSQFEVAYTLAKCHMSMDHALEARTYAEKASKTAESADDKQKVAELLAEMANDAVASIPAKPKNL